MGHLEGLRVLLIEDDALVSMLMESMLEDLGCILAASVATLDEALQWGAERGFDAALLDVNLAGREVFPVADLLASRSVPFIFASGYGEAALPERFRGRPVLGKPFELDQLADALSRCRDMAAR